MSVYLQYSEFRLFFLFKANGMLRKVPDDLLIELLLSMCLLKQFISGLESNYLVVIVKKKKDSIFYKLKEIISFSLFGTIVLKSVSQIKKANKN